ncbi:MAG TPA: prepilin-type N-terminal cleavage/methylation domain-containing protein [Kiritimatiellia bacterium]|nr:prepilin-type N-terminal cleavage/methylation domain-containing protein [Kiritimatiellia bacterium]
MTHTRSSGGFSLIEVNMAVFVMAIGILGLVALFPLGLREGVKARADLKQSMFADHALNQIVAVLSQTNMTWSKWQDLDEFSSDTDDLQATLSSVKPIQWDPFTKHWSIGVGSDAMQSDHYLIEIAVPEDVPSARILGITVRSADTKDRYPSGTEARKAWKNRHAPYYAEVLFNGDPTK